MDQAFCTFNHSLYRAQQYAHLPLHELVQLRQFLVCPACGGPSFFRGETRNGREACFGARPHAEGCCLKAAQTKSNAEDHQTASEVLQDPNKRLVVDFDYGAPSNAYSPFQDGRYVDQRGREAHGGQTGTGANQVRHVRLRPLLRLLMSPTRFSESQQLVDIEGLGTSTVAEQFVRFDRLNQMHGGRFMGVFGKLVSAQLLPMERTLWLNFGNLADPSICVQWELIPALFDRFRITTATELNGMNVLAFGIVNRSQHGKFYMVVNVLHFIAMDLDQ